MRHVPEHIRPLVQCQLYRVVTVYLPGNPVVGFFRGFFFGKGAKNPVPYDQDPAKISIDVNIIAAMMHPVV